MEVLSIHETGVCMEKNFLFHTSELDGERKRNAYARMSLLSTIVHGMDEKLLLSELASMEIQLGFDLHNCYIIATGLTKKALASISNGANVYYDNIPIFYNAAFQIIQKYEYDHTLFFDAVTDLLYFFVTPKASDGSDILPMANEIQDAMQKACMETVLKDSEYCVVTAVSDKVNCYCTFQKAFSQAYALRSLDFFIMKPVVLTQEWYDSQHCESHTMDIQHLISAVSSSITNDNLDAVIETLHALEDMLKSSLSLKMTDDVCAIIYNALSEYNYIFPDSAPITPDILKRPTTEQYTTLHLVFTSLEKTCTQILRSIQKKVHSMSKVTRLALQYMQSNFHEDIGLESIAEAVGVVPQYLSTLFNQETGIGIPSYINRLRISEAQFLLKNTYMKISSIAKHVGFTSTSRFYTLFKQYTGKTASDYRSSPNANMLS